MDLVTLAAQAAGGVLAALLAGALLRRSLGFAGSLIVGIVGGTCAGLIAMSYGLAPAALAAGAGGPASTMVPAATFIAQMAAGAAGGALLAILTGLLMGLVER